MSRSYRTRKKKLSHKERRSLADAQDATSPKVIQQRERDELRTERFEAKLKKFNEENKKADDEIEKAKAESIIDEVKEVKEAAKKKEGES